MPFYKGDMLQTAALLRKTERISRKPVQVYIHRKQRMPNSSIPVKWR